MHVPPMKMRPDHRAKLKAQGKDPDDLWGIEPDWKESLPVAALMGGIFTACLVFVWWVYNA